MSSIVTRKPAREKPPGYPKSGLFRILSVSPLAEDHLMLRHILNGTAWRVSAVATRRSAIEQLRSSAVSVIVCESVLEDGTWKDILEYNQACVHPPALVVTSGRVDEHLWAEALNLGAYDVLAKPFNDREVQHILETVSLQQVQTTRRVHAAGAA